MVVSHTNDISCVSDISFVYRIYHIRLLPLWHNAECVSVNQTNTLDRVFTSVCVTVGNHVGLGGAQWLPREPKNISKQIPEMAIKKYFTLLIREVTTISY